MGAFEWKKVVNPASSSASAGIPNTLKHIKKALEYLDKANLQGYFEEMDKVKMSPELVRQYNRQKNIFIKGKEPHDFEQRLQVLAEAVRHLFVKIGDTVLFTVYEYGRKLTYDEAQRHDILMGLMDRYKERYHKKMQEENDLFIPFDTRYTKAGTSEMYQSLVLDNYPEGQQADFQALYEDLTNTHKSLCVIGEPGAGKTVLLLQTAMLLLHNALLDQKHAYPMPVILNLATWRDDSPSFAHWLEENLVFMAGRYRVSKQVAHELLYGKEKGRQAEHQTLIVLLDGLDEIPEAHRASCIAKMRPYFTAQEHREGNLPIGVVCCRKQEYIALQQDLPVRAFTEIVPLDVPKLLHVLQDKDFRSAMILKKIVQKHEAEIQTRALLTTVFEVNIALSVATTHLLYDFALEKLHTQALVDAYIAQETAKLPNPAHAKQYLAYIAQKLQASKKSIVFELIDMQPNWLQRTAWFGYAWGAVWWLYLGVLGLATGLVMPLLIWGGLMFLIDLQQNSITSDEIRELQIRTFDKQKFLQQFLVVGLGGGLVFGLVFGLSVGIVGRLFLGLFLGIVVGIVLGLVGGLFTIKSHSRTTHAYQRLFAPFFFDFLQWSLILLIGYAGYDYIQLAKLPSSWRAGQAIGVAFLLAIIISPMLKHFVLRFLLWREGVLPLRLVSWLNAVSGSPTVADKRGRVVRAGKAGTGLLERDGGQWRFRHQRIQDRLAGKE